MNSVKILRTVDDQEAFYFYEAFGKPTGKAARNLSDFLDIVKSVKTESLMFHLQRGDFRISFCSYHLSCGQTGRN